MSFNYENIPGMNVTLNDGGLIIASQGGSEKILIIAPSLMPDAPSEPVHVSSSNDLITYGFGDFYVNGEVNEIAVEWKAAVDGGAKSIYLAALKEISMERAAELEAEAIAVAVESGVEQHEAEAKFNEVLTGETAIAKKRRQFIALHETLMLDLLDFSVDHIVLKGLTLEDQVDEMVPAFFPDTNNIENFPNIGGFIVSSDVITSSYLSYPIEIENGVNDILAINVADTELAFAIPAETYDGKNKTLTDLVIDLQTVIDEDPSNVNIKVREENSRLALYFEESASISEESTTATALGLKGESRWVKSSHGLVERGSFGKLLADYCEAKTMIKDACIGYIGVQSPADTKIATIRKYVETLRKLDTEISPYLQVVGSEVGVTMPLTNSVHYVNGATHYAALISLLNVESAPTNKQVQGVSLVRFNYSLRQLSLLTAAKIVTFRLKDSNLVVTDGVTTAPHISVADRKRESDYARLSTLRIAQRTIETVREAVDPFIGEPNQMPQYNALNTAIKSALEKIREAGVIQGYSFKIANLSSRLDAATVVLEIVPAFELRRIEVQVNLTYSEDILSALGL